MSWPCRQAPSAMTQSMPGVNQCGKPSPRAAKRLSNCCGNTKSLSDQRPTTNYQLDHGPRRDHSALRHDDNAAADAPAIAIRVLHVAFVHQARSIADARVLVDDRLVQDNVAADANAGNAIGRAILIEVGTKQHRPAHLRA